MEISFCSFVAPAFSRGLIGPVIFAIVRTEQNCDSLLSYVHVSFWINFLSERL